MIPPWSEFGVYAELPALDSVTFAFGPGSTADHGQVLVTALRHIGRWVCTLEWIFVFVVAVEDLGYVSVHGASLAIYFEYVGVVFKVSGMLRKYVLSGKKPMHYYVTMHFLNPFNDDNKCISGFYHYTPREASNRRMSAAAIGTTVKQKSPQGEVAIPPRQICTPR